MRIVRGAAVTRVGLARLQSAGLPRDMRRQRPCRRAKTRTRVRLHAAYPRSLRSSTH
jgi:hypothetical protein